ncbi:MAG: hypothetical protein OES32_08305 [Acidobacteriota bacterium]|nr:hypothetical protein [Acidobacteriota bacterium]MDH3523575.1 hypothetical protein [Acidobacteriota bacterium]
MTTLHLVAETAVAVLYAVGAAFNAVYTLRHCDEFYGAWLAGAWHEPARWLLRSVILPHARAFTAALILFQATLAAAVLGRTDLVGPALLAGAVFCVIAAVMSSPGGTVGNLALAAIQVALAVAR